VRDACDDDYVTNTLDEVDQSVRKYCEQLEQALRVTGSGPARIFAFNTPTVLEACV